MKKFQKIITLFLVMSVATFAACTHEDPDGDKDRNPLEPELSFEEPEITVPADGGSFSVEFIVINPEEKASVSAKSDVEWIKDVSEKNETITFSVSANELQEPRSGKIIVEYTYDNKMIDISCDIVQEAKSEEQPPEPTPDEVTIDITVVEAKPTSLVVRYAPSDGSLLYVPMVADRDFLDGLGSDENIFADDMAYLTDLAASRGMGLMEFLLEYVCYSGIQDVAFEAPQIDTPYYAYAYGITEDGQLCTDVFRKEFVIENPGGGENPTCTFTYDVKIDAYNVEYTVTPSDNEIKYFNNYVTTEFMSQFGETPEEQIPAQVAYMLSKYAQSDDPITPAEFMERFGKNGEQVRAVTLDPEVEYMVYAVVFDESGFVTSEVSWKTFTTERRNPNDFTVDFSLTRLTDTEADITATPSDETVRYYWDIDLASMSEEDIMNKYEEQAAMFGIDGGKEELLYNKGIYGENMYPYFMLEPGTEYRMWYISMDDQTAELCKFGFGDSFTTLGGSNAIVRTSDAFNLPLEDGNRCLRRYL